MIGRLGYFVVMAGVSWFVEACGGGSERPKAPNEHDGSAGGPGASGGETAAASGGEAAAASGGTTSLGQAQGGSSPSPTGGQGGLHDIPCE